VNNSVAIGQGTEGGDLGDAIWKGAVAGAVGGGVGAYIGPGAFGAMGGGFAGGATGSALNGGNRWEILQGGLMGAGVALGVYSGVWGYNNYSGGEEITGAGVDEAGSKDPDAPQKTDNKWLREARGKLEYERQKAILEANNVNGADMGPHDIEAGGSFRVRTKFFSGEEYLHVTDIETGNANGVAFLSRTGDSFRMHLHTNNGLDVPSLDIKGGTVVGEFYPSRTDYCNERVYSSYGMKSYFSSTDRQIFNYNNGFFHKVLY